MALPNFEVDNFTGKRYFEIVDLSFSPETVAYGEKTKLTVTIKNISGAKVSNVCVWGFPHIPSKQYTVESIGTTYQTLDGVNFYLAGTNWSSGFASVSWANNENKTFTGEIAIFASPSPQMDLIDLNQYKWGVVNGPTWEGHETPDKFGIVLSVYQPSGVNSSCYNLNNQGQEDELLHILSYRDNPKLNLNAERSADGVPNDEGVNLLSDIALSFDSDTALEHGYTASLTCTPTPEALTLNATPEQMAAGIVDSSTAIDGVLNNGVDYELSLTVTNGYESTVSKISVPRAFANVHLSGATTGGVCFGGFSSAQEGKPLFECYYPATFYGGVSGVGKEFTVGVEVETSDKWFDGRKIYRRFCSVAAHTSGTQTQTIADASAFGEDVQITHLSGMVYTGADYTGDCFPLPYSHYTSAQEVALYVTGGKITTYAYGSTRTWKSGWVMVEYAKDEGAVKTKFPTAPATGTSSAFKASSEYSSTYAAWKAFNNSIDNAWASTASDTGAWIQYKMPKALKEIDVYVYGRKNDNIAYPKAGDIMLSTDGSTWVKGGSFSGWTQTSAGGFLGKVECDNAETYQYVRLVVTTVGGSFKYVAIGYIEVRGFE